MVKVARFHVRSVSGYRILEIHLIPMISMAEMMTISWHRFEYFWWRHHWNIHWWKSLSLIFRLGGKHIFETLMLGYFTVIPNWRQHDFGDTKCFCWLSFVNLSQPCLLFTIQIWMDGEAPRVGLLMTWCVDIFHYSRCVTYGPAAGVLKLGLKEHCQVPNHRWNKDIATIPVNVFILFRIHPMII